MATAICDAADRQGRPGHRPGARRRVRGGASARALQRARDQRDDRLGPDIHVTVEVQQHIGRNQVRAVAMSLHRRASCAAWKSSTPAGRSRCRSAPPRSAASSTCSASRSTTVPPIPTDAQRWPIHRKRPDFVEPRAEDRGLRDGHQGRRPHRAVREGRKDRSLRRRRRRQDRRHHGAHQQRREGTRRQVRVLRRG